MPAPLFTGRVSLTGQLVPDRPLDLKRHLVSLKDKPVEVVIRPLRSKRSMQQNKWLWGVALPTIALDLGYDRHEHEHLHYWLVEKCFGSRWNAKLKTMVPKARSSKLSTKEFSAYMEWLVRYAATDLGGIVVPLPNEVDLDAIDVEAA